MAPDVRDALFEWFIDVRNVLKGRLPINMFITKANELYLNWLKQQPEPILEENKLKFTRQWIKGWMKEYQVSLKKPNKRFAIKKEDRIQRIEEYLKNIIRIRKFFIDKFKVDPPIINGDQMPLHR